MSEWSIRRELLIEAPLSAVWTCVATPSLISRWWCPPPTVELMFEQRGGGRYEEHYKDDGYAYDLEGTVVAYEPRRRFAVRRVTERYASLADLIDIILSEEGDCTRVTIDHSFEHLPEDRRKDLYESYADGWSSALQRLCNMAMSAGTSFPDGLR